MTFDEDEENYVPNYTPFLLSEIFSLLCSSIFIKGPNIPVHRELWVLFLKVKETRE